MTDVYLERDRDVYTVVCTGHAVGSAEVCAAVSCLVYSIAGWARNAEVHILCERLEPGDAELVLAGGGGLREIFRLAEVGFSQLALSYPDFIRVKTAVKHA